MKTFNKRIIFYSRFSLLRYRPQA